MVFEKRALFVLALMLLPVLAETLALAEPTAADRETARALMKQGTAARDAGDLKEALKNFEAADAIMRVPTTAYEVAKTRATLGMLIEARDVALSIARSQAQPGEPPPFADARVAAQKLSDDLEGRVPSIKIQVKGATDPQISIDNVPLAKALVGLPRKLNPGKHTIAVKATEGSRSMIVEVFEREAKELTIDLGSTEKVDPVPLSVTVPEQPQSKKSPLPLALMISGYGIGVAGVVISSVTGAMSISQTNTIKMECGGLTCPPGKKGAVDSANSLATVSTVALVAAGVGAAIGIVGTILFFATPRKTALRGTIGVGSIGLEADF
jgi:hypothetical protein